jgi:peptidyl-prolyl cis-trans isomerase A (cyclophilin A)
MNTRNFLIFSAIIGLSLAMGACQNKGDKQSSTAKKALSTSAKKQPPNAPRKSTRSAKKAPKASVKPSTTAALTDPTKATLEAPAEFRVKLETTKGDIIIEVRREWTPNGADRFFNLVKAGYYTDVAFFRVIPNFMAQVGMSGDPNLNVTWRKQTIPDDPVVESNTRGMVTFAKTGAPNSRSTQFFINFKDNSFLDKMAFAPFGKVDADSQRVADRLHAGYGEGAPRGAGPSQNRIVLEGNRYLKKDFPMLDYIKSATVLEN